MTTPLPHPCCDAPELEAGFCQRCGHCEHEVILNGACFYCGTTNLDPVALSPKPEALVPANRLVRRRDPEEK